MVLLLQSHGARPSLVNAMGQSCYDVGYDLLYTSAVKKKKVDDHQYRKAQAKQDRILQFRTDWEETQEYCKNIPQLRKGYQEKWTMFEKACHDTICFKYCI